jgi:hypothetical protein
VAGHHRGFALEVLIAGWGRSVKSLAKSLSRSIAVDDSPLHRNAGKTGTESA